MPEYLFIGGSRDGEWVYIEGDGEYIETIVPEKIPQYYKHNENQTVEIRKTEYYKKKILRTEDSEFIFYIPSTDKKTTADIIATLIEGYRKPKEDIG